MDCFDADALIYAAIPGHPLGQRVAALFREARPGELAGAGSVLLLPEILAKPLRDGTASEVRALTGLLARLDLRPVDRATAELATAVALGADRFITNNQRDFPASITETRITYPADLPDPGY